MGNDISACVADDICLWQTISRRCRDDIRRLGRRTWRGSGREKPYDPVCSGKGNGDGGSGAGFGGEAEGAAVVFEDAADDEEPESVALGFGGAERFVHGAHDLVRDAGTGVGDDDADIVVIVSGLDVDAAVIAGDGLVGVADEVVEGLEELGAVCRELGERVTELQVDRNAAGGDFGVEGFDDLLDERVHVHGLALQAGGAHALQELVQQGIEPLGLTQGGFEQGGEPGGIGLGKFCEFSLQKLEIEPERVEGVANLVCHGAGHEAEEVHLLSLGVFLAAGVLLGVIADEEEVFTAASDGGHVEMIVAGFGIVDLQVAGDGDAAVAEVFPEAGAAGEGFEGGLEELPEGAGVDGCGGAVGKAGLAGGVEEDDAVAQGIKHILEEPFLGDETHEDAAQLFGVEVVEAGDEFVEGVLLHRVISTRLEYMGISAR